MPYYSNRPIFPNCIISVNRGQAILNMMQNLTVSDVNRGMASNRRSESDKNQIPKLQTVVDQSETLVSKEFCVQRFVFPKFVVSSVVPKLDSKLALIEISNHRVAVGYTETKLASPIILIQPITYFKERTGNSGGRYVLGGSFTLYPSIGERSSKETDAFVKDLTDQTRHFCAK